MVNVLEKLYFAEQNKTMLVLKTRQTLTKATRIIDNEEHVFQILQVRLRSLKSYRSEQVIVIVSGKYVADGVLAII